MGKIYIHELQQMQSLPLEAKIVKSQQRIREWYEYWEGNVYISFSGGKDSTVLLHLVRSMYPEVPAVFINTGLEYPEVVEFVKTVDNVIELRPRVSFKYVIEKYGYPVVSKEQAAYIEEYRSDRASEKLKLKRLVGKMGSGNISQKWLYLINAPFKISDKCCYALKKSPASSFHRKTGLKPYLGTMAAESWARTQQFLKSGGCNSFTGNNPSSRPLSFWLEEDIWEYIKQNNLKYSKIYDMGYDRTGCIFCMFGVHLEKPPNRFQRLKETHPQLYKYCMENLKIKEVLNFMNIPYE